MSRLFAIPVVAVVAGVSPFCYAQGNDPNSVVTAPLSLRDRNVYSPSTDGFATFSKKVGTNVVLDQKQIWSSPFRVNRRTAPWWIAFGVGTAALIASDHKISEQLSNSGTAVRVGTDFSRAGSYYSVFPFAGALYVLGAGTHNDRLSETGALGIQALIDSAIVAEVLKVTLRRDRPLMGDGGGHFEKGGASFPSGHSIEAWTVATVVARQYRNHPWISAAAYAYATGVSLSRVAARQHFPSDVVASAGMGFFIGKFVVSDHDGHKAKTSTWARPTLTPYLPFGGVGAGLAWDLSGKR